MKGRREERSQTNHLTQWFTFSVPAGKEQYVPISILKVPEGYQFRPRYFEVEAMYYASSTSGNFTGPPGAIQIQLYDSTGQRCATSKPVVFGSVPRRCVVRYPASAGWWGVAKESSAVGVLNAICLGSQVEASVRGVGRIAYTLTTEALIASCPTLHLGESAEDLSFDYCTN